MAGHFYPLPPTFIGGRQPYAPKLGIAQSGPPFQPTRALATLGVVLASWAQAAPALPQQVKIAPLIAPVATANPPYTRKQFERIDAAWRADVTTVITLTSVAAFSDAPPDPDVAPIKGYKTVDVILGQWKAREYLPPQPKGLAPLLLAAVVPDAPPVRSHALLKSILDQSLPAVYRPQVSKPIAALLPAAVTPDNPPPFSYSIRNTILASWVPPYRPIPRLQISEVVTEVAPDTTPDAFSFTDQAGVSTSSTITSAAITVAGINVAADITVSGGTYSINGGAFTALAGTVVNGDTVQARHTSSASYLTATNTAVTIGGVSDTFTSITEGDPANAAYVYRPFSLNWWSH